MSAIIDISAKPVNLPLKEAFETAQRRAEYSATVFISLETSSGIRGIGEATPVGYVTGEDQDSVTGAVDQARSVLIGKDLSSYRMISRELAEALPNSRSARCGMETAIMDAFAKSCGVPVYSLLGGKAARIETDVTIPIVPPEHARDLAAKWAERGFRLFKVKVGSSDPEADLKRCLAIVSTSPGSELVVDANQGFEPKQAVDFVKALTDRQVRLTLLEQPVRKEDIKGLKWVTEHTDVPVFGDEAAQTPAQVIELVKNEAIDGVNVKLMKAGILGALDIVSICRSAGVKLMLGCMLESFVAQSASLHVACGTGAFSHFDLDSDQLLAGQPVTGGVVRNGAFIEPVEEPGLGCKIRT